MPCIRRAFGLHKYFSVRNFLIYKKEPGMADTIPGWLQ